MIISKSSYDPVVHGSHSDASAPSVAEVDPNCMTLREILQYSLRGQDPSGFFGIGSEEYEFKNESEEDKAIENDFYNDLPGSFAEALEEIDYAKQLAYIEAAQLKGVQPSNKTAKSVQQNEEETKRSEVPTEL